VKSPEGVDGALKKAHDWIRGGMVHTGFLSHYMSIRDELLETLDPLLAPDNIETKRWRDDENKDVEGNRHVLRRPRYFDGSAVARGRRRKRKILVTGHSLGGALATLGTLDLTTRYHGEYDVSMVSVASPRVGNYVFAKLFNEYVPRAVRLVHDRDPIPGVPKMLCMFKHVGHELLVDKRGVALFDRSEIEKAFVKKPSSRLACHGFDAYDLAIEYHLSKHSSDLFHRIMSSWGKKYDASEQGDEAKLSDAKAKAKLQAKTTGQYNRPIRGNATVRGSVV